jgi:hypothetical protein
MGINEIRKLKLDAEIPKQKKVYYIPKVSEKRKRKMAEQKDNAGDSGMDKFYEERRKEMTGRCLFCKGKTEKKNDETYRRSIAHLLPKRKNQFPSIALHPDNWLELCFYGESCHTNFDNGTITWELLRDSAEWEIIADKFKKIYPFIKEEEKKNIPPLLLKELKP